MSENDEINLFLLEAKLLLKKKYGFVLIPRKKNILSLTKHGVTIAEAKQTIIALSNKNYISGPLDDDDKNRNGKIWIFKTSIVGIVFYIKLKIEVIDGNKILKCLSFHEDEKRSN